MDSKLQNCLPAQLLVKATDAVTMLPQQNDASALLPVHIKTGVRPLTNNSHADEPCPAGPHIKVLQVRVSCQTKQLVWLFTKICCQPICHHAELALTDLSIHGGWKWLTFSSFTIFLSLACRPVKRDLSRISTHLSTQLRAMYRAYAEPGTRNTGSIRTKCSWLV